jgi:hypothetical protein
LLGFPGTFRLNATVPGTSICRMHGLNQATRRKARRTLALRDTAKSLRQVVEREQRILRDLQEGR